MIDWSFRGRGSARPRILILTVLLMAAAVTVHAQTPPAQGACALGGPIPTFPNIPICAFPGGYRDSSSLLPNRCVGTFKGPQPDSIEERPRTVTVRFRRDRRAEARPDFGGYRLYRVVNRPDTTLMMLIRRFSRQRGDERTWNFSVVDTSTLEFMCKGQVVSDSIVTFVDPDSNGQYEKVCRLRDPQNSIDGRCVSRFDSVFVLRAPPGPHDGFLTWYAITYEAKNNTLDGNYLDMFVPDRTGEIGPCTNPSDPGTCPNLNHKARNLIAQPVEPTAGPEQDLEQVAVVPNPFRATEAWDRIGGNEIHFINLPSEAVIKIYTVSGDLVTELQHKDAVRDFARWDLKNANGQDVSSGIYMYRVEAASFTFQDRFVVIR